MKQTVKLAANAGVSIGAHPGFPDLIGFGRRNMEILKDELENYVLYQLGALYAIAKSKKRQLTHVKVHGALYNTACNRADYAEAVVKAVKSFSRDLILIAPQNSRTAEVAQAEGLKVGFEFFADRNYTSQGTLVPRTHKNALLKDINQIVKRAVKAIKEGKVESIDGKEIQLNVHTICVHGDTPHAVEIARNLRKSLENEGIAITKLCDLI